MKILAAIFFFIGICGRLHADIPAGMYSVEALKLPSWSDIYLSGLNDSDWMPGYWYVAGYAWYTIRGNTTIPPAPGWTETFTDTLGFNDLGDVVGGGVDASGSYGGWIWYLADDSQALDGLVDFSWDITNAISINDKGQILAQTTNTIAGVPGYVLLDPAPGPDPAPEPGSIVLLLTAIGLTAATYRRRRLP